MSKFEEPQKLEIDSSETNSSSNPTAVNDIEIEIDKNFEEASIKNSNELDNKKSFNYKENKYGLYKIFLYDKNGDPIFAIGPDYIFFIGLFICNIIFNIFILTMIWDKSYYAIKVLGIIMSLLQLITYFLASTINPGLPKNIYEYNATHNIKGSYRFCKVCKLWLDNSKHYYHCDICKCCCEGYDHHCPWTTKCVGSGNIYLFYLMLFTSFLLFGYFIFSVIMMTVYISNN